MDEGGVILVVGLPIDIQNFKSLKSSSLVSSNLNSSPGSVGLSTVNIKDNSSLKNNNTIANRTSKSISSGDESSSIVAFPPITSAIKDNGIKDNSGKINKR